MSNPLFSLRRNHFFSACCFVLSLSIFGQFPAAAALDVPVLSSVKTSSGRQYVGELIEKSADQTVLFDLQLKDTIIIKKSDIESTSENLSETSTINAVGYPVFAAWKLSRLIKAGKVQGKLTLSAGKDLFVTLGSGDGIVEGQTLSLLGDAEHIKDPDTGEALGVVRDNLGTLMVKKIKNRRFSEVRPQQVDPALKLESGMLVECERESKAVVLLKPEWKSDKPNLQTGDEAAVLAEHILTELVEFGVPVFSQDEVQDQAKQLAQKQGIAVTAVSPSETARKLGAGLLVTGNILARSSRHAEVSLRVTDVSEGKYLGIITGRIRRDRVKQDFQSAKNTFKAKKSAVMDFNKHKQMLVNSIGIRLKKIPPGKFLMGKQDQVQEVTLTNPYYIGIYEITAAQYARVMGTTPNIPGAAPNAQGIIPKIVFKSPQHPIERISWNEAVEFCKRLSALPGERSAGRIYRLPTEAEWEYACRAGATTKYSFGEDDAQLGKFAWYRENSANTPYPVGLKQPNQWGLYDMHGNVREWCLDWYADYPEHPRSNPTGPNIGTKRVTRGGSFVNTPLDCDLDNRFNYEPDARNYFTGFRIVLIPENAEN